MSEGKFLNIEIIDEAVPKEHNVKLFIKNGQLIAISLKLSNGNNLYISAAHTSGMMGIGDSARLDIQVEYEEK